VQTAYNNFLDSNKKIGDLYKAEMANADTEINRQDGIKEYTVYKNGLISPYLYSFVEENEESVAPTAYLMDDAIIHGIQEVLSPLDSSYLSYSNFFQDSQSLLINAAQQICMYSGFANVGFIAKANFKTAYGHIATNLKNLITQYTQPANLSQKTSVDGNNKYSEHVIANAPEVNDLLNTFGADANFVNNVTLQAYQNYLSTGDISYNNPDGTFNAASNYGVLKGSDIQNALASQYYGKAVVTDDSPYNKIRHLFSHDTDSNTNISNFATTVYSK
jgi:hypothetical protein